MTASNVEDLFLQNQEREQALRNLLKTRPSESRDVQGLRGEIRAGYSEILTVDPEFCAAKDVELLLWKNCYYKRIEDFRKRLRKYAHLAASLERAKAFEAREHLHGICQAFARFLTEATDFYSSLLRRFEAMQHQYSKGGGGAGGNERRTKLLKLVVLSINRCFIFLGDLARYRELHGENTVKDWSSAERYYHQALAVLPTSGNPHNQLAVLATYTDAECVSVYRYCRSLMIESPFQTAHENLTLLFEKNKQKGFGMPVVGVDGGGKDGLGPGGSGSSRELASGGGGGTQHHSKGKGKGSGGRGNTGALLKSFLRRFVRLHGMVFSGRAEDLEDFPSIFETAIADFRTLLSNSAFGDALLLKMVVICIFSVTHVADSSSAAAAAAAAAGTGSSTSDPRDDSFSNSGSAADGGGSSIDGVSNSGSTGTQAGAADAAASMASKAEEVRRNARLSYPLALAFGVSAQIGRHVRTQEPTHPSQGSQHGGGGHGRGGHHRQGSHGGSHGGNDGGMMHGNHGHHGHHGHPHHSQQHPPAPVVVYGVDSKSRPSSNQPQPRPLGSRLLGPVVLFCDWLTARSQFLCLAEEERSVSGGSTSGRGAGVVRKAYASVAVQEAEMRGQFWEVIQRLAATLPDQDPTNQADAFPGDPLGRRRPLKEHVELRGFLPLADLYKKRYAMDGPAVPAVPDDCAGSVRIRGLKAFAAAVSGEPLSTLSDLRYEEDLAGMGGSHRDRSEYSGRSESSTASSGRIMHDGRPFEIALRQQGPSSQHSRAPPGMGSAHGSATGSVLSAGGGERGNRSLSGPGPVGAGYFGSGGSIGGGSDGEGWRSSKGSGLGAPGARPQHTRNSSVGTFRVPGGSHQHLHPQAPASHTRQHSQPMMPAFGVGGGGAGDLDPSGSHSFHPPLHRVHSQATGVTVGSAAAGGGGGGVPGGGIHGSGSSARVYSSRHSDAASVSGSRHSLDSGMRYYEGRHAPPAGAPGGYNPAPTGVQSIVSNHGSGSGSSGPGSAHGSAHDTHSFGAWSAPGGRSGGGVGSGGGGGGGWAAENDRGSSFRSDPGGSGDEEEVTVFAPGFGAPSRRRSTGGGGGPVVIGRRRDSAVAGGGEGGGGVGGGSDLGSAGSPQFGSGRSGSGLLGGGIWTGAFHPQPHDLALSPQAPSEHNEDGERLGSEHSLFGVGSWRGAIGSSGGAGGGGGGVGGGGGGGGNAQTPGGTPVTGDAAAAAGVPSPSSNSAAVALADLPRNGGVLETGDGSQQQQDGIGYLNNPFQASRKQQQQQQKFLPQQQQQQQSYSASTSLRGQASTGGSVHSTRSPPSKTFDHHNAFETPPGGFSTSAIPGSPNATAPRSGSVGGGGGGSGARQWVGDGNGGSGGGFQRDGTSPGQTGDQQQGRFSLPGPRQHHAAPGFPTHAPAQQQQQRQVGQTSPPLQPRQRHEQQLYGRRASSPGASSRGGGGGGVRGDGDFSSGGSPTTAGAANRSPPSTLPLAFSSGAGGGSSSLANNHDDASSIFSSNVSGHSTYSGFSGLSSINAFGGSELSSVAGAAAAAVGGSGGAGGGGGANVISASLPWRTPPLGSQKGDLSDSAAAAGDDIGSVARRDSGLTPAYAAAHGSTGGALGWGTMMGTGAGAAGVGGGGGGGGAGGGGRRDSQG